jgi:hypothetical protein
VALTAFVAEVFTASAVVAGAVIGARHKVEHVIYRAP